MLSSLLNFFFGPIFFVKLSFCMYIISIIMKSFCQNFIWLWAKVNIPKLSWGFWKSHLIPSSNHTLLLLLTDDFSPFVQLFPFFVQFQCFHTSKKIFTSKTFRSKVGTERDRGRKVFQQQQSSRVVEKSRLFYGRRSYSCCI
jgi:hypothetical protein